ncbi:MAG: transglutaminase domain-containing protein [Methanoregula sp.]|nr:transglutaminase domain-containing protein [Methanoregula sp.]
MDIHYHSQYAIIEKEGNNTINNIVGNTSQDGINSIQLSKIADEIIENFSDSYWPSQNNEKYFCHYTLDEDTGWAWCSPFWGIFGNDPHSYSYVFDKRGQVRTTTNEFIDLTYDPKWIAYQRTGACEALSILFNETATRSGFESRIVTSTSAKHTWNEVNISGEWKYYDVQRYGQVKNTNESSFWFGNRSEYGYKSGFNHSELTKNGICVFDLQKHKCGDENVTQNVTQNYLAQS